MIWMSKNWVLLLSIWKAATSVRKSILDSDNVKGKTKIDSQEKINSAKSYLFKWRIVLLEKILLFIFICIGTILVY